MADASLGPPRRWKEDMKWIEVCSREVDGSDKGHNFLA